MNIYWLSSKPKMSSSKVEMPMSESFSPKNITVLGRKSGGLAFPVGKISGDYRKMHRSAAKHKQIAITPGAAVYTATVLELIVVEIFKSCNGKDRISTIDISNAITNNGMHLSSL